MGAWHRDLGEPWLFTLQFGKQFLVIVPHNKSSVTYR